MLITRMYPKIPPIIQLDIKRSVKAYLCPIIIERNPMIRTNAQIIFANVSSKRTMKGGTITSTIYSIHAYAISQSRSVN